MIFFRFFLNAFFTRMRVRNFLTEPDTDIFIENKNVPYGRFSSNIVKELYRVSENSELQVLLTFSLMDSKNRIILMSARPVGDLFGLMVAYHQVTLLD